MPLQWAEEALRHLEEAVGASESREMLRLRVLRLREVEQRQRVPQLARELEVMTVQEPQASSMPRACATTAQRAGIVAISHVAA